MNVVKFTQISAANRAVWFSHTLTRTIHSRLKSMSVLFFFFLFRAHLQWVSSTKSHYYFNVYKDVESNGITYGMATHATKKSKTEYNGFFYWVWNYSMCILLRQTLAITKKAHITISSALKCILMNWLRLCADFSRIISVRTEWTNKHTQKTIATTNLTLMALLKRN